MRIGIVALAVVLTAAGSASAEPLAGPAKVFEPGDLFSLEWASDPQARADGGAVAYVRSSYDVMTDAPRRSIWLANPATGEQKPLLAGPAGNGSPRWSPDGRRLAYVSTSEEGRPQLFVRWLDSGASARVTSLPDAPDSIAWSPDGHYLAFTLFEPDEGLTLGKPQPGWAVAGWGSLVWANWAPRMGADSRPSEGSRPHSAHNRSFGSPGGDRKSVV